MIKGLLYILQIENYDLGRFIKLVYSNFSWNSFEKRKKIVWTKKARAIFLGAIFLFLFFLLVSIFYWNFWGILVIFVLIPLLPILISLSYLLIWPIDYYLKKRILKEAKNFLSENEKNMITVGITGSYGKTSAREILVTILKEKYEVISAPDNINTDLGIAEYILKNKNFFKKEKIIFVVEMGAYKIGEIAKICDIVRPKYSILTGINESHLERFGNLENIIKAKFELPFMTKEKTFLNFEDENIKHNFSKFNLSQYFGVSQKNIKNIRSLDDFSGIEFEYKNIKLKTKLLAFHNAVLIALASELGFSLKMSPEEIRRGVEKIEFIKNRLELIHNSNTNVWIIDDSYNGNFNGIISGIEVLGRAHGRKIIMTPGLAELGEKNQEIHRKIAKIYMESKIDQVLLIKSKGSEIIRKFFQEKGFGDFRFYLSAQEAHNDLKNIIKSGDTIIFQNDLADNYL